MFRRKTLRLFTLLLAMAGCSQGGNKQKEASVSKKAKLRPNVILIMADDMGWGDPAYNGNDISITPNLDKMAQNGLQMNRFYAAAPVCSPTRGSCITGRHHNRYGITYANSGFMKPEEITLAEVLKEQGYTTGHFGKWHLGTMTKTVRDANRGGRPGNEHLYSPPQDNGFDVCFSTESKVPTWDPMVVPGRDAGDAKKKKYEKGGEYGTYYWNEKGEIVSENLQGDDTRVIMDRALPFIENAVKSEKPFFTIIWTHTPHLPVLAGQKYKDMYKDYDNDIQHFYGCITALDEQIGRLNDKLKEIGAYDNTVVFYTSDNGPEGRTRKGRTRGTAGHFRGRKRSLYEGGVRVPGIVQWPEKIKGHRETNVPYITSDYFPTVLDIVGVKMPTDRPYDGVSFKNVLLGEKVESRGAPVGFWIKKQMAWHEDNLKLYSSDNGKTFELYDLEKDPGEKTDIAADNMEKVQEMRKKLLAWRESVENSSKGQDYL
ncbi:N-acetylgalactosamine-6-sulfatase [Fulvitalea axinellae]|uniref:N-acetylgalactosamine-6-sulfatase n=1 Tax=Fulvitalea axinellae TaxID=1182444 RepID=A0AAU9CEN1_9BACT|nr:N-acetylgalactosamine-6-sulfatase [Fulvitalea axinellae]